MNVRQLTILAVLAAVSVGVTAVALRGGSSTIASDRRGERVIPGLLDKANGITGLTVRQGNDPLSIERRGSGFVLADVGYPVKTDAVRDLVTGLIDLTFEEARTSDPARHSELGVADPDAPGGGKEVTVRAAGGDIASVIIGTRDNTVGSSIGGTYVRLKGSPQTWLARGSVQLPAGRPDWFANLDLGVKRFEIKKIELAGGGQDGVTATPAADKPGELTLENVPEGKVAETFKVNRLSTFIESFAILDVRKRSAAPSDTRRMIVDVDGGLRIIVASVGDAADGWVQISAEATSDAKRDKANAIKASTDGFEFRIAANQAETLKLTLADLTGDPKAEPEPGNPMPPGFPGGQMPPGFPGGQMPPGFPHQMPPGFQDPGR